MWSFFARPPVRICTFTVHGIPIYPSSKLHIQSLNSKPNQFSISSLSHVPISPPPTESHQLSSDLIFLTLIVLLALDGTPLAKFSSSFLSSFLFALSLALIIIPLLFSSDFFPNQPQQIIIYERDIPPIWRAEELGKLAGPKTSHPATGRPEEPSPLTGALGRRLKRAVLRRMSAIRGIIVYLRMSWQARRAIMSVWQRIYSRVAHWVCGSRCGESLEGDLPGEHY